LIYDLLPLQIMPNVDISVAVATDSGLITPIVTDVPNKSLAQGIHNFEQ
jgi:pyruvate/2-oxoglutarate dehydrogenase complex dihydrolipoamide acyltransferase (E2) component